MWRRFFNTVIETTTSNQPETLIHPNPFTRTDTSPFSWLTNVTPCFPVNVNDIKILNEPQQFYDAIIQNCKEAKERITLASLYVGNGPLERTLVDVILSNERFKSGNLRINVLLDYTRGSRTKDNSRKVLRPLLEEQTDLCKISLYHTPELRGLTKRLVPPRWNELVGLQHMKLYVFDDTLIISGANLSNDYFTNRQDRYYVIKDRDLSNFYCGLVNRVQEFSLKMDKFDNVKLDEGWQLSPYKGNKWSFTEKARELIINYVLDVKEQQNKCIKPGCGK